MMSIGVFTRTGQPIAVFGRYLAEILRSEGFADVTVVDLADQTFDPTAHEAVVVGHVNLTKSERLTLLEYLRGGGQAVVIRPQMALVRDLGLQPQVSMTPAAYVRPTAGHPVTAEVPHEPVQTHVTADNYSARYPAGVIELARLFGGVEFATNFPAVLAVPVGHGSAIVFAYDVGKAVSLIRQGDPDRIGGRTFGTGEAYRAWDLMVGWADPACWHLPQADVHAMLLANAVNATARRPQPRWWYYPTPDLRSVLVLDSDDDWSSAEAFDDLIAAVEAHEGHITIYLMLDSDRGTVVRPEQVREWRARGHSFGVHHQMFDPSYGGADEEEIFETVVDSELAEFGRRFGADGPGQTVPLTNRNHCGAWKGYVEPARLNAARGVLMDFNTMSAGPSWLRYLNGSGRPARFVDTDGRVVDCFQQPTRAYDDLSVVDRLTVDPVGEAAATEREMRDCVTKYFSPMSMLSHPVSFHGYSREYQTRCWSAARALGMPIWSAFEWAEFVAARDRARILTCAWDGDCWTAKVLADSPRGALTLMLPVPTEDVVSVMVDDKRVDPASLRVFGFDYSQIVVPAGVQACEHDIEVRIRG